MPFHSDLSVAITVSTVQWRGWKLFNLISAAEKWAENKNFKVHKFMRKISGCSFFLLLGNKLHIFIMSLGWIAIVRKWCCHRRRRHASMETILRISNPHANIFSQIWKSKFLFIFSQRWLSLQRTRNFHIFGEKSELTSKVDDVAMSIHAQRAQLFAALFFLARKKFWRNPLQYIQGRVKVLVRLFFMLESRVYCFL